MPDMVEEWLQTQEEAPKEIIPGVSEVKEIEDSEFRAWYENIRRKMLEHDNFELSFDPDDPRHFYDYRAAWKAGAMLALDPTTGELHMPDDFKIAGHPTQPWYETLFGALPIPPLGKTLITKSRDFLTDSVTLTYENTLPPGYRVGDTLSRLDILTGWYKAEAAHIKADFTSAPDAPEKAADKRLWESLAAENWVSPVRYAQYAGIALMAAYGISKIPQMITYARIGKIAHQMGKQNAPRLIKEGIAKSEKEVSGLCEQYITGALREYVGVPVGRPWKLGEPTVVGERLRIPYLDAAKALGNLEFLLRQSQRTGTPLGQLTQTGIPSLTTWTGAGVPAIGAPGLAPFIPPASIAPQVAAVPTLHAIVDALNLDNKAKDQVATALLSGKTINAKNIIGSFINRMEPSDWQLTPRVEQQKMFDRLTEEIQDVTNLWNQVKTVPVAEPVKAKVSVAETLFAKEEIAPTRQMDMYREELEIMKRAGMDTTDAKIKQEAMRRAGEKYKAVTGKEPSEQLQWQLGAPTLKGQREMELEVKPEVPIKEPWEMTREEFTTNPPPKADVWLVEGKPSLEGRLSRTSTFFKDDVPEPGYRVANTVSTFDTVHKNIVKHAIQEGKVVPPEVLKDYPGLAKKAIPELTEEELAAEDARRLAETEWEREVMEEAGLSPQIEYLQLMQAIKDAGGIAPSPKTEARISPKTGAIIKGKMAEWEEFTEAFPMAVEGVGQIRVAKEKGGQSLDDIATQIEGPWEDGEEFRQYVIDLRAQAESWQKTGDSLELVAQDAAIEQAERTSEVVVPLEETRYAEPMSLGEALGKAEPMQLGEIVTQPRLEPSPEAIPMPQGNWEDWEKAQVIIEEPMEEATKIFAAEEQREFFSGLPTDQWPGMYKAGPPAIQPPSLGEAMKKEGWPEDVDYSPGLGAWFKSFEHWAMDYEQKTRVPMYTDVARPTIEAGKLRFKSNVYHDKYISSIFKGVKHKDMAQVTRYMKELQATGVAGELPAHLQGIPNEIRAMLDYGFRRFGVAPERYIENYLSLLSVKERTRLDKEIPVRWRGFPKESIPFFQKLRHSTGAIIDDFTAEELLRIYFHVGTWSEYSKELHEVGIKAKNFPPKAKEEVRKHQVFLTGGVTDLDDAVRKTIGDVLTTIMGKEVAQDTDVFTGLTNMVYLGTIAFNPGSSAKNFTQAFHNWSETPAKWMAIGNKAFFTKQGQAVLKEAGIGVGFAPFVQRNVERYYGPSIARKVIAAQSKLRDIGMFTFSGVDYYDRGTEYLAELMRTEHWLDQLGKGLCTQEQFEWKIDMVGLHPVMQKMIRANLDADQWQVVPDMIGDQRQAMTQYRYMKEVRPQWMRSGPGRVGGQFLTWPTYAVNLHVGRYKRSYEAFKAHHYKQGSYQLWKELKWIGAVATTVLVGKYYGKRLWPWFMFLPTQTIAAARPIIDLYQAAVYKLKGYDGLAAKEWKNAEWGAKIYVPAGVSLSNIRQGIKRKSVGKALGIPEYKPKRPLYRTSFPGAESAPRPGGEVGQSTLQNEVEEWLSKQ